MNPGSCAIELLFVRFPLGTPEGNDQLWHEIDDSRIAAEARQLLWTNGFKVGIVGTAPPAAVTSLLDLKGENLAATGLSTESPVLPAVKVVKRHIQLPPRESRQIYLGEPAEELTLFVAEKSGVRGRSFAQAQTGFTLSWSPLPQGQVCLQVVPEIFHGQPRTKYAAEEGHFRLDFVRPRESFTDLSLSVALAPGEMLVIGCSPDRPGTLGYQFLVDNTEQKLLFIRLAQVQHDEVFCPEDFARLCGRDSLAK
ncbi:MAG: hypothetical protein NZ899_11505 [Thermoguttaceae bacterium]|nr:hypothetical protein [Thermoguttaceae bacterium]MDW8079532.1 hypothetical protein [Thermoguttaceae bacterium]